ncbi:MAG: alpha/beta hydrolase [bacterium]|nr:alpha/beta hydrolase [bacterium]
MKKYKFLIILLLFIGLCINVFGQTKPYPFEVQKTGKGKQAIIFIPGFASSGEVWDETKSKFETDYTCHVLTMAGFAGVKPESTLSFTQWKNGIAAYIKDKNLEKPILIGHSMGGGLALALAADYPEIIEKIIVVDAVPCLSALMNPTFKSKENNDCSSAVNQIMAMTNDQFYQMQCSSIPKLLEDTSMQEKVISWSLRSDRKTIAEMYCDFSNTDLREKITTIKCPSLILQEGYFVNIKPLIEGQYKNLKTANLQYANKGMHFIMYDDKDWYFAQLNNFIKGK